MLKNLMGFGVAVSPEKNRPHRPRTQFFSFEPKERNCVIGFKDLEGIGSWGVAFTLLLVVLGFFPILVLLGVGAVWLLTLWRASQ